MKIFKLLPLLIILILLASCFRNEREISTDEISGIQQGDEQSSESVQTDSSQDTHISLSSTTAPVSIHNETTTKLSTTTVSTSAQIFNNEKYVIETDTREWVARAMLKYKEKGYYKDTSSIPLADFIYNNEDFSKLYGEDFCLIGNGGGSGSVPYTGGWRTPDSIVEQGELNAWIVPKETDPAITLVVWSFEVSFSYSKGWMIDNYYLDEEYTNYAISEIKEKGVDWVLGG
ncbi:MAG: hypothetical protein LBT44_01105 [Clostridiales bacterium]|jgi:hypothetical protein|nr:hypothetical protein [Clostridiales bacterium]